MIENYRAQNLLLDTPDGTILGMNTRTEKLHEIMTEHRLTTKDVAKILDKSYNTVRIWRCKNDARVIPAGTLRLLQLELASRKAAA